MKTQASHLARFGGVARGEDPQNAILRYGPAGAGEICATSAFTLIEIMVVMALLAVIVLGLVAMFNQTEKAFRAGMTQSDQMEGARMFSDLIQRDLEQATPTGQYYGINLYSQIPQNYVPLQAALPASTVARTNVLEDLFFVTRANQTWSGVGYFVRTNPSVASYPDFVGTLYRFESDMPVGLFNNSNALVYQNYLTTTNASKILDGVVDFRVHCYDTNGVLLNSASTNFFTNNLSSLWINDALAGYEPNEESVCAFSNHLVPAYVEVQVGVLENDVLRRYNAIPTNNPSVRSNFLATHAGNVQVFRERIAIRNVDPSAYQ